MTDTADTTTDGSVRFDPFDPSFLASPFDQYAALREREPLHYSEMLCSWIVTRHDDVDRLLRDPSMSSDIRRATPTDITQLELDGLADHPRASSTIVHMDDPDHSRVRKFMAEPFRVREVSRLAPIIEDRVDTALDRLRTEHGSGPVTFDLFAEIAYPLPVEIFSTWLGVPEEANPEFREWTSWVARSRDPMEPDERKQLFASLDAMYDYLAAQVTQKRAKPTGDLLSYLVQTGDDGHQLSQDELMSQLITLYMAGHEPTAGLIGNAILALGQHPEQLRRLRTDPSLLRNAVAEFLRYDGPNQFVRRITTQSTTIRDVELPAGEVLLLGLASANRDPRRWGPTADTVIIDRPDANQHLQFGGGAHACIGSHLARLQAELFLGALLARLDDLELMGEHVWSTRMFIRSLSALPVRCTISPR